MDGNCGGGRKWWGMSLAVPRAPRLPASRLIHSVVSRGRLAARAPRGHLWFLQAPSWEDADTCFSQRGSCLLLDWVQREWGRLASLIRQVFMNPSPNASSGRISGNKENKLVPGNSSLYIFFGWGHICWGQAEPCAGNNWVKSSHCLPQIFAANNRWDHLFCYILQTADKKAFSCTGRSVYLYSWWSLLFAQLKICQYSLNAHLYPKLACKL